MGCFAEFRFKFNRLERADYPSGTLDWNVTPKEYHLFVLVKPHYFTSLQCSLDVTCTGDDQLTNLYQDCDESEYMGWTMSYYVNVETLKFLDKFGKAMDYRNSKD